MCKEGCSMWGVEWAGKEVWHVGCRVGGCSEVWHVWGVEWAGAARCGMCGV